ncbi:MAG: hypothetical protein ACR2F8_09640 [Caulobacteraceae bacterium]
MFALDWLVSNAYRVLGLPADAGPARIHAAEATLRRSAALGLFESHEADLPQLGPVARTDAAIRAAAGWLENPAERLHDRLFWLHGTPARESGAGQTAAAGSTLKYKSGERVIDDSGGRIWH